MDLLLGGKWGKCLIAAALMALMTPVLAAAQDAGNSPYRVSGEMGTVHIHPTPELSRQMKAQQGINALAVLSYQGGPVMTGETLYAIFWIPATLQNGSPTTLSPKYQNVTKQFLTDYADHGLANNSSQYYALVGTVKKYFVGKGGLGGTPGLNKMFLVFTSKGEGSCSDSTSASCAYSQYCAYHGFFGSTTTPTIYSNQPYADPSYCYSPGTGQRAPNGDIPSDANVSIASHEIAEANTDPELNAWWDLANGYEIGDLCSWTFGANTWDGLLANQMWNGHFYELQQEYDNHTTSCVSLGP